MAGKKGRLKYKRVKFDLPRRGAIGLLKLIKYLEQAFIGEPPFMSEQEWEEVLQLKTFLRRCIPSKQRRPAEEKAIDFVEIFTNKTKGRKKK